MLNRRLIRADLVVDLRHRLGRGERAENGPPDIARQHLEAGTIDVITSLNTQQTLFNDLDTLAQIRLTRFLGFVNLYKALGGGFQVGPGA